jgi:hypothetical protein
MNLIVPSSQIGVFGDVFHVDLRVWDTRRALLRRHMGVCERRRACHKRHNVRWAPVCREQDRVKCLHQIHGFTVLGSEVRVERESEETELKTPEMRRHGLSPASYIAAKKEIPICWARDQHVLQHVLPDHQSPATCLSGSHESEAMHAV